MRALLDDFAGTRRQWNVGVTDGAVVIAGEFAEEAERSVVTALASTVAGVTGVELRQTTGVSLAWDD